MFLAAVIWSADGGIDLACESWISGLIIHYGLGNDLER